MKDWVKKCKWKYDDYYDTWETSCDNGFVVSAGTPEDNGFHYCPYCGLEIEEEKK